MTDPNPLLAFKHYAANHATGCGNNRSQQRRCSIRRALRYLHQPAWLAVLGVFVLSSGAEAATAKQSLSSIRNSVEQLMSNTLGDNVDVEYSIGRLDPRLRLPRCEMPLEAKFTRQTRFDRPISVEVRCHGVKPWALYVAVNTVRYAETLVATRNLPRNTLISAEDLRLERRQVNSANTLGAAELDHIVGFQTARALNAGQAINHNHVKKPQLVRRGQPVVLSANNRKIAVKVKATALEDGAAGDRIRVKNLATRRVIHAVVSAPGEVRISAGQAL